MIERFNFYDIFGYLLPGILLIALCWLPFGLFLGEWPPADLASALLLVSLAYVIGHVLHALSDAAFESKFPDVDGEPSYPSELLLASDSAPGMPGENKLNPRFKRQIYKLVLEKFDTDVEPTRELEDLASELKAAIAQENKTKSRNYVYADNLAELKESARIKKEELAKRWRAESRELAARRYDAFRQCRSFLINRKVAAYTEQQQGMYVLLRGATAAFLIAAALYMGCVPSLLWAFPGWLEGGCLVLAFATLGVACVALFRIRRSPQKERDLRKFAFGLLLVAAVACSLAVGVEVKSTEPKQSRNLVQSSLHRLETSLSTETNIIHFEKSVRGIERLHSTSGLRMRAPTIMASLGMLCVFLALVSYNSFQRFTIGFAATVYRDFVNVVLQQPPAGGGQDPTPGAHLG